MVRHLRAPLTTALTRRRNINRIDPKRVLVFATVSLLALYRVCRWALLPTSDASAALALLHHSEESAQRVIDEAYPASRSTSDTSEVGSPLDGALQQRQSFGSALDPALPKWIRDYVEWHRKVRADYPGTELFNNPNAPNVLVRTCLGMCQ